MSTDDPTFQRWLPYIKNKLPSVNLQTFVDNISQLRSMTDCGAVSAIKLLITSGDQLELAIEFFYAGEYDFDDNSDELDQFMRTTSTTTHDDEFFDDRNDGNDEKNDEMGDNIDFNTNTATTTTTTATTSQNTSNLTPIYDSIDHITDDIVETSDNNHLATNGEDSHKLVESVSFLPKNLSETMQNEENPNYTDMLPPIRVINDDDEDVDDISAKKPIHNGKTSKKVQKHQKFDEMHEHSGSDLSEFDDLEDDDLDSSDTFDITKRLTSLFNTSTSTHTHPQDTNSSTSNRSSMSNKTTQDSIAWFEDLESLMNPTSTLATTTTNSSLLSSSQTSKSGKKRENSNHLDSFDELGELDVTGQNKDNPIHRSSSSLKNDQNQFVSLSSPLYPHLQQRQGATNKSTSFSSPIQLHIAQLALLYLFNPALIYSDFTRTTIGHPYASHWRYQLTSKKVPIRSYSRSVLSKPHTRRLERSSLLPLLNNPQRARYKPFSQEHFSTVLAASVSASPSPSPSLSNQSPLSTTTMTTTTTTTITPSSYSMNDNDDYYPDIDETDQNDGEKIEKNANSDGCIEASLYNPFISPLEAIDLLAHEYACNQLLEPDYTIQLRRSDMKHHTFHIFPTMTTQETKMRKNVVSQLSAQFPTSTYSIHDTNIDYNELISKQLIAGGKKEKHEGETNGTKNAKNAKSGKRVGKKSISASSSKFSRRSLISISDSSDDDDSDAESDPLLPTFSPHLPDPTISQTDSLTDMTLGDKYWVDYLRSVSEYNCSFTHDRIGALNEYLDHELYGEDDEGELFFGELIHSQSVAINTSLPQLNITTNYNSNTQTVSTPSSRVANQPQLDSKLDHLSHPFSTSISGTSSATLNHNLNGNETTLVIAGPKVPIPTKPQYTLSLDRFLYLISTVPSIPSSIHTITDESILPHPACLSNPPTTLFQQHSSAVISSSKNSSHYSYAPSASNASSSLLPYHQLTYSHTNTLNSHCLQLSQELIKYIDIPYANIPFTVQTIANSPHAGFSYSNQQLSAVIPTYLAAIDTLQSYNTLLFSNFEHLMFSQIVSYLKTWGLYDSIAKLNTEFEFIIQKEQSMFDFKNLEKSRHLRSQQFHRYALQSSQYQHLYTLIGLVHQSNQGDYFELFRSNDNLLHSTFHHPHLSNHTFISSLLHPIESEMHSATDRRSHNSRMRASLSTPKGLKTSSLTNHHGTISLHSTSSLRRNASPQSLSYLSQPLVAFTNIQILQYLIYGGISDSLLYLQSHNSQDIFNYKQIKLLEHFYTYFQQVNLFPLISAKKSTQHNKNGHISGISTNFASNSALNSTSPLPPQSLLLDNRFPHEFPFLFQHTVTAPSCALFRHVYQQSHSIKHPFDFHLHSLHHSSIQPTYNHRSVNQLLNQYVVAIDAAFQIMSLPTLKPKVKKITNGNVEKKAQNFQIDENDPNNLSMIQDYLHNLLNPPSPVHMLPVGQQSLQQKDHQSNNETDINTTPSTSTTDQNVLVAPNATAVDKNDKNDKNYKNRQISLPWYPIPLEPPNTTHLNIEQRDLVFSQCNYQNTAQSNQFLSTHPLSSRSSLSPSTTPSSYYNRHHHINWNYTNISYQMHEAERNSSLKSMKTSFGKLLQSDFPREVAIVRTELAKRNRDSANISRQKERLKAFQDQVNHANDSLQNNTARIEVRKLKHETDIRTEMSSPLNITQIRTAALARAAHDPDILQWNADLLQFRSGLPSLMQQIQEIERQLAILDRGKEVTIDEVTDELFKTRLKLLNTPSMYQILDKVSFLWIKTLRTNAMNQSIAANNTTLTVGSFYNLFLFSPNEEIDLSDATEHHMDEIQAPNRVIRGRKHQVTTQAYIPPPLNHPAHPYTALPPILQVGTYLLLNQPRTMINTKQYCHLLATLQALSYKGYRSSSPLVLLVAQLLKDGLTVIEQPTIYRVVEIISHPTHSKPPNKPQPPEYFPVSYVLQCINSVNRTTGFARRQRTTAPEYTNDSINDRFRITNTHAHLVRHNARVIQIPHSPIQLINRFHRELIPETVYPSQFHQDDINFLPSNRDLIPKKVSLFNLLINTNAANNYLLQHHTRVDNYFSQHESLGTTSSRGLNTPHLSISKSPHMLLHQTGDLFIPYTQTGQSIFQFPLQRYLPAPIEQHGPTTSSLSQYTPLGSFSHINSNDANLSTNMSTVKEYGIYYQTSFIPTDFVYLDFDDQTLRQQIVKPSSSTIPSQTPSFQFEHIPTTYSSDITQPHAAPMNLPSAPLHSPHGCNLWYIYAPKIQQDLLDQVETLFSTEDFNLDNESDDDDYSTTAEMNEIQHLFAISSPKQLTPAHRQLKRLKSLENIKCDNLMKSTGIDAFDRLQKHFSRTHLFFSTDSVRNISTSMHSIDIDVDRAHILPTTVNRQGKKKTDVAKELFSSLLMASRSKKGLYHTRGEIFSKVSNTYKEMINASQNRRDRARLRMESKDQLQSNLSKYYYCPRTIEEISYIEYYSVLDERVILQNLQQCKAFIDLHLVFNEIPQILNDYTVIQQNLQCHNRAIDDIIFAAQNGTNMDVINKIDQNKIDQTDQNQIVLDQTDQNQIVLKNSFPASMNSYNKTHNDTIPIYSTLNTIRNIKPTQYQLSTGPFSTDTITDSNFTSQRLNPCWIDPYVLARSTQPSFIFVSNSSELNNLSQDRYCVDTGTDISTLLNYMLPSNTTTNPYFGDLQILPRVLPALPEPPGIVQQRKKKAAIMMGTLDDHTPLKSTTNRLSLSNQTITPSGSTGNTRSNESHTDLLRFQNHPGNLNLQFILPIQTLPKSHIFIPFLSYPLHDNMDNSHGFDMYNNIGSQYSLQTPNLSLSTYMISQVQQVHSFVPRTIFPTGLNHFSFGTPSPHFSKNNIEERNTQLTSWKESIFNKSYYFPASIHFIPQLHLHADKQLDDLAAKEKNEKSTDGKQSDEKDHNADQNLIDESNSPFLSISEQMLIKRLLPNQYWETIKTISSLPPSFPPKITMNEATHEEETDFGILPQHVQRQDGDCNSTDELFKFALVIQINPEINPDTVLSSFIDFNRALHEGYVIINSAYISNANTRIEPTTMLNLCSLSTQNNTFRSEIHTLASCYNVPLTTFAPNTLDFSNPQFKSTSFELFLPAQFIVIIKVYLVSQQPLLRSNVDTTTTLIHKHPLLLIFSLQQQYIELFSAFQITQHFNEEKTKQLELRKVQLSMMLGDDDFDASELAQVKTQTTKGRKGRSGGDIITTTTPRKTGTSGPAPTTAHGIVTNTFNNIDQTTPLLSPEDLFSLTQSSMHSPTKVTSSIPGINGINSVNPIEFSSLQYNSPLQFRILFDEHANSIEDIEKQLRYVATLYKLLVTNNNQFVLPLSTLIIQNYTRYHYIFNVMLTVQRVEKITTLIQQEIPLIGPHKAIISSFVEKLNQIDSNNLIAQNLDLAKTSSLTSNSIVKKFITSQYSNIFPLKTILVPRPFTYFSHFLTPEFKITTPTGAEFYLLLKTMISSMLHHPLNKKAIQEVILYESVALGSVSQRYEQMHYVAPLHHYMALPKDPLSLAIRTQFKPHTDILPQHVRDLVQLDLHDYQHQTVAWMLRNETSTYNINSLLYTPFMLANGRIMWFSLPLHTICSQLPSMNKRGGIIATDMGLGKTVCCLATIAANPRRIGSPYSWQEPGSLKQADTGTIVITESLKRQQILLDSTILHHYTEKAVNSYFDTLYNPKQARGVGYQSLRLSSMMNKTDESLQHHQHNANTDPHASKFSEKQLFDALSHYVVPGSDPFKLLDSYYARSNVTIAPIGLSSFGKGHKQTQVAGNGMLSGGTFESKSFEQIILGASATPIVLDDNTTTTTTVIDEPKKRGRRTKAQKKQDTTKVRAKKLVEDRFAISESESQDSDNGDDALNNSLENDNENKMNDDDDEDITSANASNVGLFTSPFSYSSPQSDPVRKFIRDYVTSAFQSSAPSILSTDTNVLQNEPNEPISNTYLTSLNQTPALPQSTRIPTLSQPNIKFSRYDNSLPSFGGISRELETDLNESYLIGNKNDTELENTVENDNYFQYSENDEESSGRITRRTRQGNTFQIQNSNETVTTTTTNTTPTKAVSNKGGKHSKEPSFFPGHIWSGGTLIIVPTSTLGMWIDKIKTQTPHLSICMLFDKREQDPLKIATFDIAITTNYLFSIDNQILSQIDWHRIVIDEAQWLRSRSSIKAASLRSLQANSFVLVTGTPYSSHITEMRGLLDILGVDTLGNVDLSTTSGQLAFSWYYRQILSNMCIRHTKLQPFNGKRTLVKLPKKSYHLHLVNQTMDEFNIYQKIYNVAHRRFNLLSSADAIRYNAFSIIGMLNGVRRASSIFDVDAPQHILRALSSNFFTTSLLQYEHRIEQHGIRQQRVVDQVQAQLDTIRNSSVQLLDTKATKKNPPPQSRLQDIFDSQKNIIYDKLPLCNQEGYEVEDCVICFCEMDQPVLTGCLHSFCASCLSDLLRSNPYSSQTLCPICRKLIDPTTLSTPALKPSEEQLALLEAEKAAQIASVRAELEQLQAFMAATQDAKSALEVKKSLGSSYEEILAAQQQALLSHYQSGIIRSSKMRILLSLVEEIIAKDEKVVVFTQFQHSLDYIKKLLQARSINFGYTDGTQNALRRDKEVRNFTNNPLCSVFVVGYRVGSVGITLNAANHVILCDPCLNRAQEEQACNRIYRLGQKRDVQIHYLISKGTIEEQIYLLNESRRSAELAHTDSKDKKKASQIMGLDPLIMLKLMQEPFISSTSTKSTPARPTNITTYTMNSLANIGQGGNKSGSAFDDDDADFGGDDISTTDKVLNLHNYFKNKAALAAARTSLSSTFQANSTAMHSSLGFDILDLDALEQEENSLKDAFDNEDEEENETKEQDEDEPIITVAKKKTRGKKKEENVTLNDNDYIFMFSISPHESIDQDYQ